METDDAPFISIIIPVMNGERTIARCLQSALESDYPPAAFEVMVVDDCSTDNTAAIAKDFGCSYLRLNEHGGAARARNAGARAAKGDALFFTDADCLMMNDTLKTCADAYKANPNSVMGGTYTLIPEDKDIFGKFQSAFVHYSELKRQKPDYIATHAMLVSKDMFFKIGGFDESYSILIEDVEFSHRARNKGVELLMIPGLQVRHIFNFSLWRSLRNAFRKAMHWTAYSIRNKDLFIDSGTASFELKINTISCFFIYAMVAAFAVSGNPIAIVAAAIAVLLNIVYNLRFFKLLVESGGVSFLGIAGLYYMFVYPFAVASGGVMGAIRGILR